MDISDLGSVGAVLKEKELGGIGGLRFLLLCLGFGRTRGGGQSFGVPLAIFRLQGERRSVRVLRSHSLCVESKGKMGCWVLWPKGRGLELWGHFRCI